MLPGLSSLTLTAKAIEPPAIFLNFEYQKYKKLMVIKLIIDYSVKFFRIKDAQQNESCLILHSLVNEKIETENLKMLPLHANKNL